MPTYEYLCNNCGHELEKFQSMSARPLRKCPECKKATLKRLLGTGAGIIFKGSGFYQTDYRGEGYKKQQEKEKSSTTETSKKTTDKKDSAAGKTDSKAKTSPKEKKQKG